MQELITNECFYNLCIVVPILSLFSFLSQALPLSLLVYLDPVWIRNKYIKGRPSDEEILHQISWGLYYSILNHIVLFASLAIGFPILERYARMVMIFDDSVSFLSLKSALQFIMIIYLEDYLYYNLHRLFHCNKRLFRFVHALHHTVRRPVAMAGHYMTVSEFFMIGGTVILTPFLVGTMGVLIGLDAQVHYKVLMIWIVFRQFEASEEHCGFESPLLLAKYFIPAYDGPAFHYFHHFKVIGNYGAITAIHDKYNNTISKGYLEHIQNK
ncbi:methylsterol monooxygenase [Acrasis kona]|uniref:Methylsterol monooxygenase n=1 Tax=Acrasis kona TaxID=1008807 RepID=A0AAW2Z1Y8_9EUKA